MEKHIKTDESIRILKALLNDIPSAVLIIDSNNIIRMHNLAFQKIFVEDDNSAVGKPCGNAMQCDFVVKEGADCGKTTECSKCNIRNIFIQSLLKKEVTREKISKTYYFRETTLTRHFYYTTKLINFDNEEMTMVLIDDITELEEKNKKLEELNNKKNEFMRIASHDIRSPIASIFTFSDLLLTDGANIPAEKQTEFIQYIRNSSMFSINLLNDLLDFSVLESGFIKLNLSEENYISLTEDVVETYKYIAKPKRIKIVFYHTIDILEFYFDRTRIEQVLHNLLSNAVKYSPENSKVSIHVSKTPHYIITRIDDEGPGINEQEINSIFKPFNKGSNKATGGEKSTGLGLSICKLIVSQHQGEIWVESTQNKGSSFYFKLPYKRPN
ncbi:MAG: hypothetical protein CVU05_10045 [Bacteroidetes bacterium HGW-Bacteroidetes-21]|jgi:signal transduction histidine kinase|nr:MAG: hypothetical protein CVU05_10045 [Bacteroidetes bacterium HGW-Bacteroidetes-21]